MREPLSVCANGLKLALGLGRVRWESSAQHAKENTFPVHGLVGKKGNKKNTCIFEAEESMKQYLEMIGDKHAEVPSTRMVRLLSGFVLRKEEDSLVELPHHFSKRGLYRQWCFENGHVVSFDAQMKHPTTNRPFEDSMWPESSVQTVICSWPSFTNFWEREFPNLRIRPQSEDTCGECHIVAMRYKYKSFRAVLESGAITVNTEASAVVDRLKESGVDFGDEEGTDVAILKEALQHVEAAQKQRALHNKVVEEAEASCRLGPSHPRRIQLHAFTADFC